MSADLEQGEHDHVGYGALLVFLLLFWLLRAAFKAADQSK